MGFLKLLLVLLAFGFVVSQARLLRVARASRRWRSVKGQVLRSFVEGHRSLGGKSSDDLFTYSANVVYSYTVDGRHFDSNHLTFGSTTGLSEDSVTQLLDGITEGTEVDVFYDPLNHAQAVLIPGSSGGKNSCWCFRLCCSHSRRGCVCSRTPMRRTDRHCGAAGSVDRQRQEFAQWAFY